MWEIHAYQNADSLQGIFNAAAAIHASNDYRSVLAAVAACGFLAALFAYAFAPEKLQGWKWLATVVLVFSVLVVPKVTVGIVDRTGGAPVKIVDNVPLGIAALGSITSTVGATLTGLFETAFQVIPGAGGLPSELTYQKNGLLFGNRMVRETGSVVFQDPAFRTDLVNFIHNCTSYDLIDGTLDPTAFSRADDVWSLMATPNPARFTTVSQSGSVSVDTCPNVYRSLDGRIPAQIQRIEGRLAFQVNPTLPGTAAVAVIAAQIQQAYLKNNLADAAASAAGIIRQNAVLNAMDDAAKLAGQKANDPAAMVLAVGRAQAIAQQNASWLNYGKVAEQALPVFRNVVEAITYALFPLFVLLLLLSSGRDTVLALKGYVLLLIWIQLWPPLFAILNYMASIYAAYDLAAAADLGGGARALTLQTASSIYSRAISAEAVVGYLAMSIPFIAWAATKRLETLGTAMVGGLSGLQGSLSAATGGAATGNLSLGNVSMDQAQLAPNRTSAFMGSWQSDISGNTMTSNPLTGRTAVSMLRNQGFASRVVSMRVSQQEAKEASEQADAARTEAVAAAQQRSASLVDAFTRGQSRLQSLRSTSGTSSSSFEQLGEGFQQLDQIARSVSQRTGVSQSQVAHIAFSANGSLGLGGILASAKVQGSAGKTYQSGILSDEQKVLGAMNSEQLAAFKQFGDRVSRDSSYLRAIGSDGREAREMASRLATDTSHAQRAEAAYAQRKAFAERLSAAHERGDAISIDLAQDPHNLDMFMRYSERYGGTSAAAHTLMASELARQGLPPNRVFSDGTPIQPSLDEFREAQRESIRAGQPGSDIDSMRQHNDAAVSARQSNRPPPLPAPAAGGVNTRAQVLSEKQRLQQLRANVDASSTVDSNAERTTEGTLRSRTSQLGQTSRQLANDANATLDAAKDAIKDLIRRK
ncbi:conjugal transfer protein TraG N-terminal domain-containing protein [Comamonadaceae bacterium G21597-S1]|nr:conjugal transfer protein TraG N-terminal domain-containing protein [Comamonadaceae bacterium G21597-S1]